MTTFRVNSTKIYFSTWHEGSGSKTVEWRREKSNVSDALSASDNTTQITLRHCCRGIVKENVVDEKDDFTGSINSLTMNIQWAKFLLKMINCIKLFDQVFYINGAGSFCLSFSNLNKELKIFRQRLNRFSFVFTFFTSSAHGLRRSAPLMFTLLQDFISVRKYFFKISHFMGKRTEQTSMFKMIATNDNLSR